MVEMSLCFTGLVFNDFSMIVCRIRRLSVVLFPGLPPCWMLPRIPASSIIGVSLAFKIVVHFFADAIIHCYHPVVCKFIYVTFPLVDKVEES